MTDRTKMSHRLGADWLKETKATLQCRHHNLVVVDRSDGVKGRNFLHVWKPFSPSPQNITECLPSFHVIIREDEQDQLNASLYSFHGKLLMEETSGDGRFKILEDLDGGVIRLCQGVQDLKTASLEAFWRTSPGRQRPLHEKIRALFMIEPAPFQSTSNETVFRSRLCNYLVYKNSSPPIADQDFARCDECQSYSQIRKVTFFTYLQMLKDGQLDDVFQKLPIMFEAITSHGELEEELDSTSYRRVFNEASQRDANFYKALNTFKVFTKNGLLMADDKDQIKVELVSDLPAIEGDLMVVEAKEPVTTDNHVDFEELLCDPVEILEADHLSGVEVAAEVIVKNEVESDWVEIKQEEEDTPKRILVDNCKKNGKDSKEETKTMSRDLKALARNKRKVERRKEQRRLDKLEGFVRYPNRFNEPCPVCLQTYRAPSLLKKCVSRHEESLDLDASVPCPLCSESTEKRRMAAHFTQEHPDLSKTACPECLELVGREGLRRHIIRKHHTAGKPKVCDICARVCSSERELKVHMEDHQGIVGTVCPICGQSFAQRKGFERHIARNHQPRDIGCLHCEQKFENKDQASRHLAMHSGYKPFKCHSCSYRSYKTYNVRIHVKKTHGKDCKLEEMVVDEEAREQMSQRVRAELKIMLSKR